MVTRVSVVLATLAVVAGGYEGVGSRGAGPAKDLTSAVVLRVTVGGHAPARLKIPTGGRASVQVAGERWLSLSPVLDDGTLELVIQDGWLQTEGEAERLRIGLGERAVDAVHGVTVDWLDIDERAAPGGTTEREPCTICCVTCQGLTWCACEVLMSCGHCCCEAVCTCEFEGGR